MRSRALLIITGIVIASILLTGACSAGFVAGRVFDSTSSQPLFPGLQPETLQNQPSASTTIGKESTPQDLQELFAPFWQVWQLIHDQYVDQPVDDQALMRGAIKGMLSALGDQHTSYLDPEQYQRANALLNGEAYEGIGATVDITGEYLSIVSPIPGSPAEEAGLKPGDQIIAVDGKDMTGIDGELVRQQVIGPSGTTVVLTIRREGLQQPFDVTIKRAKITVPSVEGKMLDGNVAYVHLYTFGEQTKNDLHVTLKDLMAQKPAGLILDIRNNGGGYLETAIDVASEFIPNGVIMYEQYGNGKRITYEARPGGLATQIPMIVLINEGSASASEIVAGAIQDRSRGKLVGVTSYGKGSVQNYTPLVNDQGAVRVTIARWLTPNERQIHGKGLEPDVKIEITPADIQAGHDPQLDKAVEILTQK